MFLFISVGKPTQTEINFELATSQAWVQEAKASGQVVKANSIRGNLFAFTLILVFLCAWTTALLGVHAIFGAFLFGLIVPRDSRLYHDANEYIEDFVMTIMLPLYFAISGLKTDITQINDSESVAMVFLVCVVATVGKFVGCGATSYFCGMSIRESAVIGILMNTRGMVELIVLNLGTNCPILSGYPSCEHF